tara:strand:- start:470 stop:955 length:486 start_codon:yes stop_codon:yes gene_type:complete
MKNLMDNILKKYKPNKGKEIILVLAQFLIVFLHFLNFTSINSLKYFFWSSYKNYFAILLIMIGMIGIILSIKDLGNNISPFPTPLKNGKLISIGLYKWFRHPMYYSSILISVGIFILNMNIFNLFLTISLIFIFRNKIKIEDEYLKSKYKDFHIYKKKLKI